MHLCLSLLLLLLFFIWVWFIFICFVKAVFSVFGFGYNLVIDIFPNCLFEHLKIATALCYAHWKSLIIANRNSNKMNVCFELWYKSCDLFFFLIGFEFRKRNNWAPHDWWNNCDINCRICFFSMKFHFPIDSPTKSKLRPLPIPTSMGYNYEMISTEHEMALNNVKQITTTAKNLSTNQIHAVMIRIASQSTLK